MPELQSDLQHLRQSIPDEMEQTYGIAQHSLLEPAINVNTQRAASKQSEQG